MAAYEVYLARYLDQHEAAGTDPLDPAAVEEFTAWLGREDPDTDRVVRVTLVRDAIDRVCWEAADRGLGTFDGGTWADAPGREAEARMYLGQRWGELLGERWGELLGVPDDDDTSQAGE
jgi:hypothetical protein